MREAVRRALDVKLRANQRIVLHGLKARAELNGAVGTVKAYDAGKERYKVEVGAEVGGDSRPRQLLMKRANLVPVEPAAEAASTDTPAAPTPPSSTPTPTSASASTSGATASPAASLPPADLTIRVKVVASMDGSELYFKCRTTTPLQRLMTAFCNRQGVAMNSVRFLFDGQRLNQNQTPGELEMEDGDVIDVMVEQFGD
jgi:small ubiquitin-related modifier